MITISHSIERTETHRTSQSLIFLKGWGCCLTNLIAMRNWRHSRHMPNNHTLLVKHRRAVTNAMSIRTVFPTTQASVIKRRNSDTVHSLQTITRAFTSRSDRTRQAIKKSQQLCYVLKRDSNHTEVVFWCLCGILILEDYNWRSGGKFNRERNSLTARSVDFDAHSQETKRIVVSKVLL